MFITYKIHAYSVGNYNIPTPEYIYIYIICINLHFSYKNIL